MNNRTADIVGDLETENYYLRQENERLKQDMAVARAEINRMTTECAMLMAKSHDMFARATKMETIMQHVSGGLVAGLNELKQDRERRRIQQFAALEEETGEAPAFLQQERTDQEESRPKPSLADRIRAAGSSKSRVDVTREMAKELGLDAADHVPRLGSRTHPAKSDYDPGGSDSRLPQVNVNDDQGS